MKRQKASNNTSETFRIQRLTKVLDIDFRRRHSKYRTNGANIKLVTETDCPAPL